MAYNKKYGIVEDKEIIDFHKSRWMFCIKEGKVIFAPKDVCYSHAEWFEKEDFGEDFMDTNVRGFIDKKGKK